MRGFQQIQIPVRVVVFAPIGLDDQIFPFMKEISNRDHARLPRLPPNGFQEKNGLRTKLASNPSVRETDQEGIDVHKPFYENIFHDIHSNKYFTSCSISYFLRKSIYSS